MSLTQIHSEPTAEAPDGAFFDAKDYGATPRREQLADDLPVSSLNAEEPVAGKDILVAAYASMKVGLEQFMRDHESASQDAHRVDATAIEQSRPGELERGFMRNISDAIDVITDASGPGELTIGMHTYRVVDCTALYQSSIELFRIKDTGRFAFSDAGVSFYRHDGVHRDELGEEIFVSSFSDFLDLAFDLEATYELETPEQEPLQ